MANAARYRGKSLRPAKNTSESANCSAGPHNFEKRPMGNTEIPNARPRQDSRPASTREDERALPQSPAEEYPTMKFRKRSGELPEPGTGQRYPRVRSGRLGRGSRRT